MSIPTQRAGSPKRRQFAFLIHPRTNMAEDFALVNPLMGKIPNSFYEAALRRLPIKPWVMSTIKASDRPDDILGHVIVVPLSPAQLLGKTDAKGRPAAPREFVLKRINDSIDYAVSLGASLIGLGALTAPAAGGGTLLRNRTDVGVTNGNAFTAAATADSIKKVATGVRGPVTIALIGATGSVGTAVARVLARDGVADELMLVGRSVQRLNPLAAELGECASVSVDMADCRRAQIVVLMTSATDALLKSEHLGQNAIVVDDTQPRNTSADLLAERPDVTIIDGGVVKTPGLRRSGHGIGIANDTSFACLAETALLALDGHEGHGTLGRPKADLVDRMQQLALTNAHLGFHLADPTSFGQPLTVPGWNAPVTDADGVLA